MIRTIGVVTVGRSDYGSYVPLLRRIQEHPQLRLQLIVSGAHLLPEFGHTIRVIEADGFSIDAKVETLLASDTPAGIAKSVGLGVIGCADALDRLAPDELIQAEEAAQTHAVWLA